MIYNDDEEDNFLSDKRVEEKNSPQFEYRRRGGSYIEENEKKSLKRLNENDEESSNILNIIVIILSLIVVLIAVFVIIKIVKNDNSNNNDMYFDNKNNVVNNNTDDYDNKDDLNGKNDKNNENSSKLSIGSINDNYNAYPVTIESIVYKKGGNFYNNTEKIKGDKVYVEYKQIKGLKDENKQTKINQMLEELSTELYDKNYLSDKDVLFVDIHTKLSVNFNTLSYVVYRTGEDIDGKRFGEEIKTLNIRLDTLEEIDFEELFTENTNIKNIYTKYVKGNVDNFYFDPQKIYVYDNNLDETEIDMYKNYTNIAIYKRFNVDSSLFTSNASSKKVFTILESTVSTETKDRDFEENK